MANNRIIIDKDYVLGKVDDRLYSSFVEHLGRAVYTGIYEPGHAEADGEGFRRDVLELVRELRPEYVRYPGGNFLSGYRWTDGVGPKDQRPKRLDLAWRSIESNEVGIDEFSSWAKKAGTKVMAAVNMGTGTPQDALDMLEYCNFPSGTFLSDLRIKNGAKNPHGIKLWCVGNEMDGPWQICGLSAEEYGRKALEAMKMMKWADPLIETVVCGSSHGKMATYPAWDRVVLEHCYDKADYISLHNYFSIKGNKEEDEFDFLSSFMEMEGFIKSVTAAADYVKALKRSKKTMNLSFDEWNIWNGTESDKGDWLHAPALIENRYTLIDALAFGGLGITLINHSDRVKIACLAQLVNAIAPILTERGGRALRQTTFYPFMLMSKYGRGTALTPIVKSGKRESCYGDTPLLHSAAVYDEENGGLNVFILNIDSERAQIDLGLRSFADVKPIGLLSLNGPDMYAKNTFGAPDTVTMKSLPLPAGLNELTLPARSWNLLRIRVN